MCLNPHPFVHLPKVLTSMQHFLCAACVTNYSNLFLIYMNFILLFIQFLVALILVVAKLSVATYPHIDFGYVGFSFLFLYTYVFSSCLLIYPVFLIGWTRCLHLQFNISGILSYLWRCSFTMNATDNLMCALNYCLGSWLLFLISCLSSTSACVAQVWLSCL
jgi:hypothetical protein